MAEKKLSDAPGNMPMLAMKIVGMVLLAGIIIVAIIRDRIVNPPQWQVSIIGDGKVTFVPDVAKVDLGVRVDKVDTATDALQQINANMDKVIAAVVALGIDKKDITTQNYSLSPQYDNTNNLNTVVGYGANEELLVTVRGVDKNNDLLGKVIAQATAAGANQVNSVSFEPSNLEVLKQQARLLAIADARIKARQLARAMNVHLGKVVGWWENYPTPYVDAKGAMGIGGGPVTQPVIPIGSGDISIEMNISYQIK